MFQELYMRKIAAVAGAALIIALCAYTYTILKGARYMYEGPVTISVTGKGEVFAKPDIATFSFTVEAKDMDAVAAQNKVSDTMGAILAYLKESGVEEKDVKVTNYGMNPHYEYPEVVCQSFGYCPPREPKMDGYEVSQTVSVKVRDTNKAGEIISQVGGKGALNVSGLTFTIDGTDALKAQAREKAIADARAQANVLAQNLGARIVRMNGYWENEGGGPIMYGMGGDMAVAKSEEATPRAAELPLGENTITSLVTISYEVR